MIWRHVILILSSFFVTAILSYILSRATKLSDSVPDVHLPLSLSQKNLIVDFLHCKGLAPDYDGYIGHAYIPEDIMIIYRKKYSKVLGWEKK